MNSGLLDADRYNDTIIGALGTMKASTILPCPAAAGQPKAHHL